MGSEADAKMQCQERNKGRTVGGSHRREGEGSSRVGTTPYVILVDRRAVYSYYGPGRGTKRRARPARVYSLLLRSNAVTTMYCRSKYEQQQVRNYCSNTGVVE